MMIFLVLFIIPLIDFIYLFKWADLLNWYLVFGYVLLGFWLGAKCIARANTSGIANAMVGSPDLLPKMLAWVLAGFMFFAPGPLTDLIACAVLLPWTRKILFSLLIKNLMAKVQAGGWSIGGSFGGAKGGFYSTVGKNPFESDQQFNDSDVIEVSAREVREASDVPLSIPSSPTQKKRDDRQD